jgi:CRP-like cAMP-binding protein
VDRAEAIKNCELFKRIGILKQCELCKRNELEEKLYIIEEGLAGICFELGPLSHRQVQSIGRLDVFGWEALIEPFRCTTSVKAVKKTRALSFKGKELYEYCSTNPEAGLLITRALTRVISKRLRDAFSQVVGISCDT